MKPEYIDALHALARDDVAVNAFMRLKYQSHEQWDNVLVQMVLHLAAERAELFKKLVDARRNAPAPIIIYKTAAQEAAGSGGRT